MEPELVPAMQLVPRQELAPEPVLRPEQTLQKPALPELPPAKVQSALPAALPRGA
jgi:hypothetical protein